MDKRWDKVKRLPLVMCMSVAVINGTQAEQIVLNGEMIETKLITAELLQDIVQPPSNHLNGLIDETTEAINLSNANKPNKLSNVSAINEDTQTAQNLVNRPEKTYQGKPISMAFQDVPIRNVLDVLAQVTGLNIVTSDSVTGTMTLRLMNVPWDQVLDVILQTQNLIMREENQVLMITPSDEAAQRLGRFSPLHTEYIRLNYASVKDVQKIIKERQLNNQKNPYIPTTVSPTYANSANASSTPTLVNNLVGIASPSLLSPRGTVTIDERTNMLIIKDTAASIENIKGLISRIDIQVEQVMIEARIVSASDSFSRELGVNWGILSNTVANNNDLLIGGSQQTLWDLRDNDASSYRGYDISRPNNLNVDLGIDNAAGRIAFGLINLSDIMIDLELSAMQAEGRGEVISTPKILTGDKQTAKVVSGTQIPYQESVSNGVTATRFIEAALSLEVTPSITPDGNIGMQLNINNDAPRQLATGEYAIDTNSISTNVIVKNGQTVVLGGVYRNAISNAENKVPVLGDVPVIGNLFKQKLRSNQKEELLIFVTPKLVGHTK
ncbi:type IV pilus secretin PilQ [Psychrobacter sp. HD31]|uniref:type IV pilus secretin PilQ n=1 Tax=Psychrobacter sp. HD31 TaxID=3112003 RepID=UPI003DA1EF32